MLIAAKHFIPILTSEAGLCLTSENWQEVKVTAVSYYFENLLFKPGQDVLKRIDNLSHYLVWPGIIILNAMSLVTNKEGNYVLKSPYDGSKIKLTFFDLIELVQHLKPNALILPKNCLHNFLKIWDSWNDSITPFIHVNDLEKQNIVKPHGVYFNDLTESNCGQVDRWPHIPRYVMGNFQPKLIQNLRDKGIEFIETDEPAKAAIQGKVYNKAGIVDLTATESRMQFETIDADCVCPTCSQQLTRAYLHHLLHHTPLLCQRFLIQHNVFHVNAI